MKGPGRIRRLLLLPAPEKRALVEAMLILSLVKVVVGLVPFRWIARHLGRFQAETEQQEQLGLQNQHRRVFRSIRLVSRRLPWTSSCLVQAIAGQRMLMRRGLATTLYLGLARDTESGELLAHAWLRSGTQVLTGGSASSSRYTVVGSFASGDLESSHLRHPDA